MSDLARALLDELAADPVALDRLRELVAHSEVTMRPSAPAYTVARLRDRAWGVPSARSAPPSLAVSLPPSRPGAAT